MEGLAGLVDRVVALIPPFQSLLVFACYIVGIICALSSLRGFAAVSEGAGTAVGASRADYAGPLSLSILAVAFISLSTVIAAFLMSFFGTPESVAATEVFAYAPELLKPVNNETGRRVLIGLLRIVQFIGLVGFIRGVFMCNKAVIHPNQGYTGRGITHMVGGIFAINIVVFLQLLEQLLIGKVQ